MTYEERKKQFCDACYDHYRCRHMMRIMAPCYQRKMTELVEKMKKDL